MSHASQVADVNLFTRADYRRYHAPLGDAEFWMPDIENEDNPQSIAGIDCFMLDSVIEYPSASLVPFSPFRPDTEPATGRDYQRQMANQPGIGDASVRRDYRVGGKQRKHSVRGGISYHGLRQARHERHGNGAMPGVSGDHVSVAY